MILEEAREIVDGVRQDEYGTPRANYERMAKVWSVVLKHEVEPRDVLLCLLAMKLVRESTRHKRDNLVDLAGYAELLARLEEDGPDFG